MNNKKRLTIALIVFLFLMLFKCLYNIVGTDINLYENFLACMCLEVFILVLLCLI